MSLRSAPSLSFRNHTYNLNICAREESATSKFPDGNFSQPAPRDARLSPSAKTRTSLRSSTPHAREAVLALRPLTSFALERNRSQVRSLCSRPATPPRVAFGDRLRPSIPHASQAVVMLQSLLSVALERNRTPIASSASLRPIR
ncbi:MAG: hypothetical protein UY64_C0052G0003 [Parcubacteria group bacterium GW2011_GWA1_51_12]|nr:MAG: hypothetical protein UY64_C0052G0003 [Parcubacteria group bacterium GW2011_GWA1_51_12]